MKEVEEKTTDRRNYIPYCRRYCIQLLRLSCFISRMGLAKPFHLLAQLYDKNPIYLLLILPFLSAPIIYGLIYLPIDGAIKAALTVLLFVVFSFARAERDGS